MSTFTLIRHGPTTLNAEGRLRGWIDPGLSADGHLIASRLPKVSGKLFSSDLRRAVETAGYIGAPNLSPCLRPWNVGIFAGQPTAIVHPRLVDYQRNGGRVPFGESWTEFVSRYTEFLRRITFDAVFVTHFRNCKLVQAWAAGDFRRVDMDVMLKDDVETGRVLEVQVPW